jgi:hypothetical protein
MSTDSCLPRERTSGPVKSNWKGGIAERVILPSDEDFEDGEGVEGVELLGSQGRLILCY